jgi:hypothetical protein
MTCRFKIPVNLLLIQQREREVMEDNNLILIAYYINTKNKQAM